MAATPLLAYAARRLTPVLNAPQRVDPELTISPAGQTCSAIIVGYGRVGKVVASALGKERVSYIAADNDPETVVADRRTGHEVYFGDAADPEFLKVCGIDDAAGVIITINERHVIDNIVACVRSIRPDIPIVARARDAGHACQLYAIGATEVVPETVEASLQLSQSALLCLGAACRRGGRPGARGVPRAPRPGGDAPDLRPPDARGRNAGSQGHRRGPFEPRSRPPDGPGGGK